MRWHDAAPDRLLAHRAMSESRGQGHASGWAGPVTAADHNAEVAP